MTTAEWQAHVSAWAQAGAIQHALWERLANAHIDDADDNTLAAQRAMAALTPDEAASQVRAEIGASSVRHDDGRSSSS